MTSDSAGHGPDYIALASDIVSAYVSNNHVAPQDLPALIGAVHAAVTHAGTGSASAASGDAPAEKPSAAQIRRSVQPEGIVSFIDGRSYKTLKRHLTVHGLDPRAYRTRYGLPDDYPMVAASYSERRSSLAKAIGLGVPGARAEGARAETAQEPDAFDDAAPDQAPPKGRRRKAA